LAVDDQGRLVERPAPTKLRSNAVVALDVYGSLFYAGARTLQIRLPDPGDALAAVVVLRLRGRTMLGATSFSVLADYAERLAARGGRLYLSGVDSGLARQIDHNRHLDLEGPIRVYDAEPALGASTIRAVEDAQAWLVTRRHVPDSPD
jgi:SulP family sulfate permease